ncbi:MAG: urease subunit alpha [Brevinematales bacterium]|nr:urease subunit alpha [Brevinematales bacterium]
MSLKIDGIKYTSMYGPTKGDRLRLGDTELIAEVENDLTNKGNESIFGGGKVIRDGMGQSPEITGKDGAPDMVITNVVVIDYTGIYKADIGIKDGKISAIGASGNPAIEDNITPGLTIGTETEILSGEGLICTAGGIDVHVHFICPQIIETALASGITTLIGGGTGPATGSLATTCTPGKFNIYRMLEATDVFPINIGLCGKGNSSLEKPLEEQIMAGVCGLKIHEDWGTTPSVIDTALRVADKYGIQIAIHTDTLNEAGFVENTIRAINGRTIHTYHSEGAGGGHSPDLLRICGEKNILPSSTTPTNPYTINTVAEHRDMIIVCHHLDSKLPEDIAFADSRVRPQTIAAEDILHDMGAISIISSDSQAMGRIGEVIMRTWQTAHKMKVQFGPLEGETNSNDNKRIKRYIAKYTICPAITHGLDHVIGSIEVGKFADLSLWKPEFFGVHPEIVIKGGFVAYSMMGEPNASIPTPQPSWGRHMYGSFGTALQKTSIVFVNEESYSNGVHEELGLKKIVIPIKNTRKLSKKDLPFNDALPKIEVNPKTYEVRADGKILKCDPLHNLPLTQRYFIF